MLSRRDALTMGTLTLASGHKKGEARAQGSGESGSPDRELNLYFGDLHTHSTLSDGDDTPEACMAQASGSLDFYALTDHAQFCDLPHINQATEQYHKDWRTGVPAMMKGWPDVQQLVRTKYEPGRFVTLLAYEWSSNRWGDHNVYYLQDNQPLRLANSLAELHAAVKGVDALVFPHHTAYPPGHRGYDWQGFSPSLAPIVEIFSFHGCSETDYGPFGPTGNPMGPRCKAGSTQRGLDLGHVFGFVASTDSHHGFPAPYNEGLAAVYAETLTRESLWEAFRSRRTYAVSGDRIRMDFRLNGLPMGSVIPLASGKPRQLAIEVDAWDWLEGIEVIKNGRMVKRWTDFAPGNPAQSKRFKVPLQWGFHGNPPEKTWSFTVQTADASVARINTRFKPPGRHQATLRASGKVEVASRTQSTGKYGGHFQQVVLDVHGAPHASVAVLDGTRALLSARIGELLEESKHALPFGPYGGALQLSRAVAESQFRWKGEWEDVQPERPRDYYYVRAFQKNGQACWSSPIFVDGAHGAREKDLG